MKKKIISLLLIITVTSMSILTGCGKQETGNEEKALEDMDKDEIIVEYNTLKDKYYNAILENESLNDMLKKLDTEANNGPSVAVMSDGSGNLSLNTYTSKMIFPNEFAYPKATEIAANSKIDIVQSVSISPNDNWITKIKAASVEMEHTTGVEGIVKLGYTEELYKKENLKAEVIEPWFKGISNNTVVYSNIFLDGVMWGTQASAEIFINEEQAQLVCGMLGFSNTSLVYIFVYRGAKDANKDEAIKSILNTISMYGHKLTVG